jgi:hypothetical protein
MGAREAPGGAEGSTRTEHRAAHACVDIDVDVDDIARGERAAHASTRTTA